MAMKVLLCSVLAVYASALTVRNCSPTKGGEYCTLACCGDSSSSSSSHLKATFLEKQSRANVLVLEPDFTLPRCTFTDRAQGRFRCWTSHDSYCGYPNYTCTVQQGSTSASVEIQLLPNQIPHGIAGTTESVIQCRPPIIKNVTTTKHSDGNVTVTWKYTKNDSYIFCNGSRRFSVAYLEYETYNEGYNDRTIIYRRFYNYHECGRRKTEFNVTGLNFTRYFRFLVKARRGNTSKEYTIPAYSFLQHFLKEVDISWREGSQHRAVKQGESVTLHCEATGVPAPTITHRKGGSQHQNNGGTLVFRNVKKGDEGRYACEACHYVFDNHLGTRQQVCNVAHIRLSVIPQQYGRDCVRYTGHPCFQYIHSDWEVFTSNDSLVTLDRISDSDVAIPPEISKHCQLFIQSVLCHTLLPYCDPFTVGVGGYAPLPICHQSCAQLESRCGGEIEMYGDRFSSIYGQRFSEYLWEKCKTERSNVSVTGPGDKPGCVFINPDHPTKGGPDFDLPPQHATLNCKLGNGRSYRGHQERTSSGLPCQKWSAQWPNQHQFSKMMGGELETASKFCRNPGGLGEHPWCFVNDSPQLRWEYCDIPDCEQCTPYTGDFCRHIGYSQNTSVVFRMNMKDSIMDVELELRGSMHALEDELTPGCELVAMQLLCYGALPVCSDNVKQSLCEHHCHLLHQLELCPPNLQKIIWSISYLNLTACENCTTLPLPSPTAAHSLPDPTPGNDGHSDTCLHQSDIGGHTYSGNVSVTRSQVPCLPWRKQSPSLVERFPELKEAYCRNPGHLRQQPWCYTSNSSDWDYCNITVCAEYVTGDSEPATSPGRHGSGNTVTIFSVVTVLIIFVLLFVAWCMVKMMYKKLRPGRAKGELNQSDMVTSSMYFTNMLPAMAKWTNSLNKIEKSKIKYTKQLGQGNFGIVFEGVCECLQLNNKEVGGPMKVAVKTLKEESSKEAVEAFVREAKLLNGFNHPHIVTFHGVCMEDLPFYMVFEFMDRGDLCDFLRRHSSSAQRRYNPPMRRERISSDVSNESATLGTSELLDICKQLANGMAYLESMNHIHRDLACRNCLVSSGMIVKIADFGMSQNLYSKDYYRLTGEASLPVRWMPPESIVYGTFSTRGDVWSFGVVMWEIFSFGMQPYWGSANDTVVDMIRKGTLLEQPEACPDKLYSLIKDGCWRMYENDRMTFAALDRTLHDFRLSDSDISMSLDVDSLQDMVFEDSDSVSCVSNDNDKED